MLVIFQEEGLCDLHACRGMHVGYIRMQRDNGSSPQPVKREQKIVVDDFDRDAIRRSIQAMIFSR